MPKKVKCKKCGKQLEKSNAYLYIHITKSGKKQNQYYCSKEEFEENEEEKEYLLKCKYITDDLYGKKITTNDRNLFLSKLHKKGYSYKIIYHCIKDSFRLIEDALVIRRVEFKNAPSYNVMAYMFKIIENKLKTYKMTKDNSAIEVDCIDEYKHKGNKTKKNKPTLMDLIKKGSLNGK